jgi:hypothetical protein
MLCDWRHWWALQDLNLEPTDYESAALTLELRAQIILKARLTPISCWYLQNRCGGNCGGQGACCNRRCTLGLGVSEFRPVEILEPFERPLQPFGHRVHVSLRYRNATLSCDPHDSEGVGAGFPKPGQHRMSQRMYHEGFMRFNRTNWFGKPLSPGPVLYPPVPRSTICQRLLAFPKGTSPGGANLTPPAEVVARPPLMVQSAYHRARFEWWQ